MTQFGLPLEWPADPRDDDFLVTASNDRAVRLFEHWSTWPVRAALLVGPRKSGRTLLARIFVAKTGGQVIDDAERASERDLFHAWNRAQEGTRPLVIIADTPPPDWAVALPDLRSRLAASPLARIGDPDEALMRSLFARQFLKRGLDARDDLLDWLVRRIERSHVALLRAVDELDQAAIAQRRRLSVALARVTLAQSGMISEDRRDMELP